MSENQKIPDDCPYGAHLIKNEEELTKFFSSAKATMTPEQLAGYTYPFVARHQFDEVTNAWMSTVCFYEDDAALLTPKHPRVGVSVAIMRNNQVLLGKRKGSHGAGAWGFPGGHLEHGESPEACARREVAEETGLVVADLMAAGFTNDYFPENGKHYITLLYFTSIEVGEVELREPEKCEGWEWFPWNKLPEPLFLPIKNYVTTKKQIY